MIPQSKIIVSWVQTIAGNILNDEMMQNKEMAHLQL